MERFFYLCTLTPSTEAEFYGEGGGGGGEGVYRCKKVILELFTRKCTSFKRRAKITTTNILVKESGRQFTLLKITTTQM